MPHHGRCPLLFYMSDLIADVYITITLPLMGFVADWSAMSNKRQLLCRATLKLGRSRQNFQVISANTLKKLMQSGNGDVSGPCGVSPLPGF